MGVSAMQPAPQLESDNPNSNDRMVLRESCFEQPWKVRFWPLTLVIFIVATCLFAQAAVLSANTSNNATPSEDKDEPKALTIATALLGLGIFIVGYHQWRAARRESAMDQYYGRLEIANQRLAALPGIDPMELYVFAELDNLEYVIEKYRLGYMNHRQALRGLEAFQGRFRGYRGATFAVLAERSVMRSAGYNKTTQNVVSKAIEKWNTDHHQAYQEAKRALATPVVESSKV